MNSCVKLAYRIDPVLWVREVLGVEPAPWQAEFLRAPAWRLDHRADGAAGRQDHHRELGDRALSCCLRPAV